MAKVKFENQNAPIIPPAWQQQHKSKQFVTDYIPSQ